MDDLSRVAWDDDDRYWRTNYRNRPYAAESGKNYEFYQPAYRYGYKAAQRFPEHDWDELAFDLEREWKAYDPTGSVPWDEIAPAVRDSWDRVVARRAAIAP
jgi:hypothetical protein